jgi:hypothetical protein
MLDPNTTALLNQLGFDAGLVETLLSSAIWLTALTIVTAIPTGIVMAVVCPDDPGGSSAADLVAASSPW